MVSRFAATGVYFLPRWQGAGLCDFSNRRRSAKGHGRKDGGESFAWSPMANASLTSQPSRFRKNARKEKKAGFDQTVVDADYQFAYISII